MNDGAIFAFHTPPRGINNETTCTLNNTTLEQAMNDELFQKYCIGFIDVNGVKRPNKETRCNDNKAHYTDINSECFVDEVTDIFPVIYYDAVVAPAQPQPEQYYISNLAYLLPRQCLLYRLSKLYSLHPVQP